MANQLEFEALEELKDYLNAEGFNFWRDNLPRDGEPEYEYDLVYDSNGVLMPYGIVRSTAFSARKQDRYAGFYRAQRTTGEILLYCNATTRADSEQMAMDVYDLLLPVDGSEPWKASYGDALMPFTRSQQKPHSNLEQTIYTSMLSFRCHLGVRQ